MITSTYAGSGIFRLTVDTHSGSMDAHIDSMDHAAPADLPLDKMAYLQDSAGNVYQPVYWQGDTSGHHLNGTLRFTKFDDSKSFKLVLKGVEGVEERVLQW